MGRYSICLLVVLASISDADAGSKLKVAAKILGEAAATVFAEGFMEGVGVKDVGHQAGEATRNMVAGPANEEHRVISRAKLPTEKCVDYNNACLSNKQVARVLEETAARMQKSLPERINRFLTLKSASATNLLLNMQYEWSVDGKVFSPERVTEMRNDSVDAVCQEPNSRELLKLGATLGYAYFDNKGALVDSFAVVAETCRVG